MESSEQQTSQRYLALATVREAGKVARALRGNSCGCSLYIAMSVLSEGGKSDAKVLVGPRDLVTEGDYAADLGAHELALGKLNNTCTVR